MSGQLFSICADGAVGVSSIACLDLAVNGSLYHAVFSRHPKKIVVAVCGYTLGNKYSLSIHFFTLDDSIRKCAVADPAGALASSVRFLPR